MKQQEGELIHPDTRRKSAKIEGRRPATRLENVSTRAEESGTA